MPEQLALCTLCAKQGKTCCMGTDIYVTQGDVRRIAGFILCRDFFEFRTCSSPEYGDQSDDPLWNESVFRPDGSRRVIKRNETGACMFLGTEGCLLPLQVRPLICRLHPHIYTARGLSTQLAPDCPVHLLPSDSCLETAIAGFCNEEAACWHHLLYEEISEKENETP